MSNYAVGYTVSGSEPQKDADGEEYVPEHAVPIVDGVAVAESPVTVEGDGEDQGDAPRCTETTAAGKPCKGAPGDDGLCAAHRKQKEASDGSAEPVDQDADQAAEAEEDGR